MVVGTSVVDTAAIAGDDEIVVVVWVTVVVVEVSIDGASAMTPVAMVGWAGLGASLSLAWAGGGRAGKRKTMARGGRCRDGLGWADRYRYRGLGWAEQG